MGFARAEISKEYQVKAVFLFNFAQFVQWPKTAFEKPDAPFCIGVLGDDPFDGFIDETIKGEKVNGHPMVIHRFHSSEEAKNCQILFVSHSAEGEVGRILRDLKGQDVLTVGDDSRFTDSGGVIGFFLENNKIRFKINLEAAKRGHLVISSKILRLAEVSGPGKE
ncbi:MAG TPA: YfiR family protein [bacterium]|nr:YfiR family protein [bacterium]